MKIKNVEAFPVKQPKSGLAYTLIKITTDDGLAG
jgi:hypothetical protein